MRGIVEGHEFRWCTIRRSNLTADLRCMLNKRAGKATLLWIAGHYGIAGNEEADACVKQAAAITKGIHPTSLLRPSQCTSPLNTYGPTVFPLQNKGCLH